MLNKHEECLTRCEQQASNCLAWASVTLTSRKTNALVKWQAAILAHHNMVQTLAGLAAMFLTGQKISVLLNLEQVTCNPRRVVRH